MTPQQKARKLAWQRRQRRADGNAYSKRYEKTPAGFLMRCYRNMQSRVTGVQWKKAHLYRSLPLLPRAEFYDWALTSAAFHILWQQWVRSGYSRKLTPSVDRINPEQGYALPNMQWVTHSENSRAGNVSRHHGPCRSITLRMQA